MSANLDRHSRHILLKEIGGPGQARLSKARVLIIGAGGLGCPAALYLTAAGIGRIRLVDPDRVSLDNLQRQILFETRDVGFSKTEKAADRLRRLDPDVHINPIRELADEGNLPTLVDSCDVILDGSDSFKTRLAVNQAALNAKTPLVSGAVGRWHGQVAVFDPTAHADAPCYQCLVPAIPPDEEKCSQVGIVGALTGVIGSVMALETIKLIAKAGTPLRDRIQIHDTLEGRVRTSQVARDPDCPACGSIPR